MPGEGPLLLDLFPLVGYIVAAGMVYALFAIVKGFGGVLGAVNGWTGGVLSFVLSPATAGFKWLDHELGTFAQTLDRQIAISLHRVARLVIDTAELFVGVSGLLLLLAWKYSGLNAAIHLIRQEVHIGRVAHATSRTIIEKVTRIEKITTHAATATEKAVAGVAVKDAAGWIPYEVESLRNRSRIIEHDLARLNELVKAYGAQIAEVAGAGAITAIIARELPWFKCKNVNRAARHLCGLPINYLEKFLAGSIEALVVTDLCELIALESVALKQIEPEIVAFVSGVNTLVGCHGMTAPRTIPLGSLSLPPANRGLTLAA